MNKMLITGWMLAGSCLLFTGCEIEVPEPATADGVSFDPTAQTAVVEQPEAPPVDENFATVDEGLQSLITASEDGNRRQQLAAYTWLCGQGPGAVPKVAAAMNDSSLPMEARRAACRVLGHLGPTAASHLITASRSDEAALKLRAIETMPAIDPPQREILDRLIELLDDSSDQVVNAAIRSIGAIGTPATRAGDKLLALRDDVDRSETTRHEAGKSLKLVRPRRTFDD